MKCQTLHEVLVVRAFLNSFLSLLHQPRSWTKFWCCRCPMLEISTMKPFIPSTNSFVMLQNSTTCRATRSSSSLSAFMVMTKSYCIERQFAAACKLWATWMVYWSWSYLAQCYVTERMACNVTIKHFSTGSWLKQKNKGTQQSSNHAIWHKKLYGVVVTK